MGRYASCFASSASLAMRCAAVAVAPGSRTRHCSTLTPCSPAPCPSCLGQDLEQAKQSILHLKAEIAQLRETSRTFEAVKERVTEQALKRSMAAVRNQEAVAKQQAAAVRARACLPLQCCPLQARRGLSYLVPSLAPR